MTRSILSMCLREADKGFGEYLVDGKSLPKAGRESCWAPDVTRDAFAVDDSASVYESYGK